MTADNVFARPVAGTGARVLAAGCWRCGLVGEEGPVEGPEVEEEAAPAEASWAA